MNYKQTAEYIIDRRKKDVAYAQTLLENALFSSAELKKLDDELKDYILKDARGESYDKKSMTAIEKKYKKTLDKLGLSTMLDPPPHCSICNDTAFVNGHFCDCVKQISINNENLIELSLNCFENSNFSLYEKSDRDKNKVLYENIERIADKYPNNKKRLILLYGATGTGKTFLASCMASKMLQNGQAVTALTAFGFVKKVLQYHTTFNEEKLSHLTPLLDSDLLIIDDLGTESILKNVTLEYLYVVISERINAGKLTLITTNLSTDGILTRYGERIYSRLLDKSLSYNAVLNGKDLRTK